MTILTHATHLQIRGDDGYVLEKFISQLRKRHDLSDEMVTAFELLLDAIRETPKNSRKGHHHFMSRPARSKERDVEALRGEEESNDEFEDAQESLGLVSDDLSTILRHRRKPASGVSNE